jgi:23S rRNA pseudouridine2605 synthase
VTATGERLQKVLAQAGLGSRRACEELIAAGRVTVNGEVATLGSRADPEVDAIEVDGARIGVRQGLVHYLLNKPASVVTTASDPQGRPTVVGLVPAEPRVYPVGRLDADTEGLLVLTNDGDLAHRLAHPSFGVPKTYLAEVTGPVARDVGRRLRDGIELEDGLVQADNFKLVSTVGNRVMVEVSLHEGRKHVVRRMMAAVGYPVSRLVRTAVGPIALGSLRPGKHRRLTQQEVGALYQAVGL